MIVDGTPVPAARGTHPDTTSVKQIDFPFSEAAALRELPVATLGE